MNTSSLFLALSLLATPAVVSAQTAGDIVVAKVPASRPPTSQAVWKVTLPPRHLTDQAWLVVDGKSQGLAGYDLNPDNHDGSVRLYANIDGGMDRQVKDVLKAQGLPVKENVTVYQVTYGTVFPGQTTMPLTLTFQHQQEVFANRMWLLPMTTRCTVGQRVTLFDAIMADTALAQPFGKDQSPRPGLPPLLEHHVQIQVQFLRVGADGKVIQQPATP